MFACFSDAFELAKGADMENLSGKGQSRYNREFFCAANEFVSGKRMKKEQDSEETEAPRKGLFHKMDEQLIDSLVMTGKYKSAVCRETWRELLKCQAAEREKRQRAKREKKLNAAEAKLIPASYLQQQYNLLRCWVTAE
jgi:hypothetical protein